MIYLKENLKENILFSEKDSDNNSMEVPDRLARKNVILLKSAIPGKKYIIDRIIGGHGINGRLNAMGIVPNEVITVIFQTWGGPLTVAVKGVRIALGRGITHKIVVSELDSG